MDNNQRGAMNVLLIPFIMILVFFVTVLGFAAWAYTSRQDYKDNSDQKAAVAAEQVAEKTREEEAIKYAEEAKKPFDTYIGSSAFGNITVKYPKTWSAYVDENARDASPIDAYFNPGYVHSLRSQDTAHALRVELVQLSYDQVLNQFNSHVQTKKVVVQPYKLEKVPSVVGSRIEGQITPTKQGVMVILPLRNMTLKVWTESNDYRADLDKNILPNLSFVP